MIHVQTLEPLPVKEDEQYVSRVTLIIIGWLLVTFLVAAILAVIAL